MQRESFRSRLGFLLVSAGCAIGIGNVWRFPYVTGQNGGGFFVLIYLICLLIMGVPVLTMELAVGRAGKSSAVLAYRNLEGKGHKWHIHGWFCLLGCVVLMMYYTTVTGWMIDYFGKFLTGSFHTGMDTASVTAEFGTMLSNPSEMVIWTEIVVIVGSLVCSFGLQEQQDAEERKADQERSFVIELQPAGRSALRFTHEILPSKNILFPEFGHELR